MNEDDIVSRMANILRRLRGLKAPRKVSLNQIALLEETHTEGVTLASGAEAHWQVTVVCGDKPIVIGALDGYPGAVLEIQPNEINWNILGDTAIGDFSVYNAAGTTKSATIIVRVWGLNGLSASIVRTS